MRNKARALAATYHFAALKIARARMIAEFYAKNPQGDGEPQPDVVRIAEEELYRVLAGSLTQFIQQFDGTPEAQAARVITARLLLHINEIPDAVAILDDFDWGDARVGDILGAVELSEFFRIQKIQTAPLLLRAAGDAGSIEEQMDVLLLALRLNNDGSDLPTRILKIIEGSAESVNDKAAVILGQAELVFRLTPAIVEPLGTPGEPQADTGGVDTGKQPGRDTGGTDQGQAREPIAGQPQPAGMPVKNQSGTVDGSLPRDLSGADDGIFTRIPGDVPDTAGYIESIQRIALKRPIRTVPIEPGVVGIDPGDIAGQPIGSGISGVQGSAGTPDEIAGQAKLYVDLLGTVAQKFPSTPAAIVAVRRLMAFRLDAGMDGIPFDGVTDDGSEIQLSDFAGEVLLLDFWSTGSIESLADRPKIAALYDTYHANGLDIVSINLDDDADVWIAKALTADLDMDWHNVIEGTGLHSIFARSYNVDGTPHRVLIDGEGDVIATDEDLDFNGGGIESAIQRAILALKPVPVDDNPIIIIDEEPYSGPEFKATLEIDGSDVAG
ncbi:MAG: TlpA family protein disulfide reductase, partial [Planctomycetota bacterium]